ncbi:MAG: radical SAM protein [Parcubacteria group bacterium]
MKKQREYIDRRPVSFLDIVAARAKGVDKYYWSRLAYQVTFIVTQICNMRCTYCYDKSRVERERDKKELSSEEIIRIIQEVRSLGIKQIKITGGEALLKPGIEDILNACKGVALYLCTNGTLLEDYIPVLSGVDFEKLHIHSSLDGLDSHVRYAKNGTTAKQLLGAMKKAKDCISGVHIGLNTVINHENIHEFCGMYDAITETGIDKWTISIPYIVSEVVRNNHPFPEFEALAKAVALLLEKHFALGEPIQLSIGGFYKHEMFDIKTVPPKKRGEHPCMPNCNGARGMIIDSFGNVLNCLLDNAEEEATFNDFREGSFVDLTQRIKERPFYRMKIGDVGQCCECRYLKLCGSGCRYNSKVLFGDYSSPDPIRCSCYPLMEKYILPVLTDERRKKVWSYLNLKGNTPPYLFRGVREMLDSLGAVK